MRGMPDPGGNMGLFEREGVQIYYEEWGQGFPVFIIAPDKTVKLTLTYPASTGRNFDEILRVIDSLQLTANYQVATPVDWKHGDDCVVVPAIKNEDIPEKFPKGHKVIKPYLRTTPQPNL